MGRGARAPTVGAARRASVSLSRDTWFWAAPFAIDGDDRNIDLAEAISEKETASEDRGLVAHLDAADKLRGTRWNSALIRPDLDRWVALVGLAGPANVAWRALRRVTAGVPGVTDDGVREPRPSSRQASVRSSTVRRSWRCSTARARTSPIGKSCCEYCHGGNLQAVLDEYLHHLVGNESPATDEAAARHR